MSEIENSMSMIGTAEEGNQFLTFTLAEEEFGIDILQVQEIKGLTHLTHIPNMPDYIKGVMNLRGTVVPVVDLRSKFSMPASEYNQFTVIIVVNLGSRIMGLVVDAVSDVLNVGADSIEAAPDLGVGIDTAFLTGLAKSGDRLVTLLNINHLLRTGDETAISSLNPSKTKPTHKRI
ncbi:MAG: chemotaxis protein CheW [Pirellulaceae bacterium]